MKFNIQLELDWIDEEEGTLDEQIREQVVREVSRQIIQQSNGKLQGMIEEAEKATSTAVAAVGAEATAKVREHMETFFARPVITTDRWGSVEFEGTFEQLVTSKIEAAFYMKVDKDGRPSEYSSAQPLMHYLTEKHVYKLVQERFKGLQTQLLQNLDASITKAAREELSTALLSTVDLSKLQELARQGLGDTE